ncbi:hypothetical protein [Microbacterium sp. NPDC080220]|uniref:hypothetical protein n=1 Tax=Microbacterium sp. NPDC080220 TaxID=3161017 RepID=UPI00344A4471
MAKTLNTTVVVRDPNGATVVLHPGEKVPDWAKDKIKNPHVWTKSSKKDDSGSQKTSETPTDTGAAATPETPAAGSTPPEDAGLTPPPKVGAGSGADAWREYAVKATAAAGLKLDIADDAKRADIIAALDDAKIATA